MNFLRLAYAVYRKEVLDAARDRRTMAVVFISGVLMGPLILIALSGVIGALERHAERREVLVYGLAHAPSLQNYFERQTWSVKAAPANFEEQLRDSRLSDPVLVIPEGFEADLVHGELPLLEVVTDSANRQSASATPRVLQLLAGFNQERATLSLALRGVSSALLQAVQVEERNLASTQTRAFQITGMLPFFVLMAVLYGALNAALDTTAGERERGSLEPLAMNPASSLALVMGKWGAVASIGMLVALLNCFSFIPAQWLLRSDTLQAMFQFGWYEALMFLMVLLPFAAALSAVLMAVAIRCKSFKEAQASATVVILGVSLMPLITVLNPSAESAWHLWVPALAQNTLMSRVLKGESFTAPQLVIPLLVSALLTLAGLWFVSHHLRKAAVR
jgi:sodium transport system permease protein